VSTGFGRNSMEFKFQQVLRECIEGGLRGVVGEMGMKALLFRIECGQFIDNPEEFHRDLCLIFGEAAVILEKVVIRELFSRLGIEYEERGDFDFSAYVKHAKELFIAKSKGDSVNINAVEING
jgi:hypothetical protein